MSLKSQQIHGKVIAVSNRHLCKRPFLEQIRCVCEWHPEALILREKDLTEGAYEKLAESVIEICAEYEVTCILHTFWQVAEKLRCPSIHLPLPVLREFREQCPQEQQKQFRLIGTSIHSIEDATEAQKLGATYLTAGHIYASDCKKGLPPRGIGFLKGVCEAVDVPVYAIGGIRLDEKQWEEIHGAGAAGGCIMSGMMTLSKPGKEALRPGTFLG